jgi:hypothetical protein
MAGPRLAPPFAGVFDDMLHARHKELRVVVTF